MDEVRLHTDAMPSGRQSLTVDPNFGESMFHTSQLLNNIRFGSSPKSICHIRFVI
jgi:hypothetical protein